MNVVVVCKSDSTGGAAVVSRRLTEALRLAGENAEMLVQEKLTGFPWVHQAGHRLSGKLAFIAERLQIFLANGFSWKNLFKVDTAAFGLPLHRHPLIVKADVVILNWVNQGMLSLKGVEKICREGKRVIWTMHDMWNFTGICHHAMECHHFEKRCGDCFLLGKHRSPSDLSAKIHSRKKQLYASHPITFVAVSSWLAGQARSSSLLNNSRLTVIPNPFDFSKTEIPNPAAQDGEDSRNRRKRILFSAASIDNWIKGRDIFKESVRILSEKFPNVSQNCEIAFLGNIKKPESIEDFALPTVYLGCAVGDDEIREAFRSADVVVNSSHFENLPGTLIEGQAYGAIPVAFNRGGQADIITHLSTGYLTPWSDDPAQRAENLAEGIAWALDQSPEIKERMRKEAEEKFSYFKITELYRKLF